jgi:hypothetical protein
MDVNQQKHFICRNINYLSDEDRIDIAKMVVRDGKLDLIRRGTDGGSRINLDLLDEVLINQIYTSVKYKLDKLNAES